MENDISKMSDSDLIRELYSLLNDKELNIDVEKQNLYLELEL